MRLLLSLLLLPSLWTVACGPDYPNDENHRDVENEDCHSCHFYDLSSGAPLPPSNHWESMEVDSSYEDCKGCHDQG